MWAIAHGPVLIDLGDTDIKGNDQQDRREFVGLVNPDTGEWVCRHQTAEVPAAKLQAVPA